MKICHLTSVHSEKDTRIFIKECQSLAKEGFEVHFVVPGAETTIVSGVTIHGVDKTSGNRFSRMTSTVENVYKKGIEIDAQVYHFHDPELMPIGLKLKKLGKKVIYDIHEDLPRAILSKQWIPFLVRKPLSLLIEYYENYAVKKYDYLLTATPYITDRFKKINPNTININNYPLLGELENPHLGKVAIESNQVCYVGGLSPIRGLNQIIASADLIKGILHIAGPIAPKEFEQTIRNHEKIKYEGFLDREQVKQLLANSVAGLVTFLPEPNHVNAQPNKMFEYMSAGLPVISSDFPAWRTIIENNNCGICVNPSKPEEISKAINYLIKNPSKAAELGRNGREAIETQYNWEQESEKLIETYKKLMDRN